MKLCIAEKPSVAKELAQILGAKSRKDGYFEGNGYQVSWTFGHLCTLKSPDEYTPSWKRWSVHSLPMIPPRFGIKVMNDKGVIKQFETIKALTESCDEVINCGDAGIEGELIQRWVLAKAKCKKPLKRLWISSLTDEAIREGFKHLKEGSDFDLLYAAGNARAIGDWLLGMNATRLYTLKYANNQGVLSVGRVQTPTLALIVNRHLEIENFKPVPYWELKTTYKKVVFNSTHGRYKTAEEATEKLKQIAQHDFEVKSFTRKEGKESPPRLFDLTSLQVECNRKLNLSADETLKQLQKLYEQKLVTYPRVDTTYLPTDMYPKIGDTLKKMTPYRSFTEPLLKEKIRKTKKVFDNDKITDHHAIIPTGITPSSGLPHTQKLIYDLIAKRFIAAFYPDCIVSNTTVIGDVNSIGFKATGKQILKPGWRELFPKKESDGKEESDTLPIFEKGERGPHAPDLQEKETVPPKPHTEASLLRAMETAGKQVDDEKLREAMKENGIGRPSTRANIIETLFKRKYISRVKKNLIPTSTGLQLIDTIQNKMLKSVELTGQWERKLRLIENGEYEAKQFLDEMKEMVTTLVQEVKSEKHKTIQVVQDSTPTTEKSATKEVPKKRTKKVAVAELTCPKCGSGKLLKGNSAYGCSHYKQGCSFRLPFVYMDKKLTDNQIIKLVTTGKSPKIGGFILDGEKHEGTLSFSEKFDLEFSASEPTSPPKDNGKLTCPKCGKGVLLRGKKAYGCSEYKSGCHFIIPFEVLKSSYGSEVLTPEILKKIAAV